MYVTGTERNVQGAWPVVVVRKDKPKALWTFRARMDQGAPLRPGEWILLAFAPGPSVLACLRYQCGGTDPASSVQNRVYHGGPATGETEFVQRGGRKVSHIGPRSTLSEGMLRSFCHHDFLCKCISCT